MLKYEPLSSEKYLRESLQALQVDEELIRGEEKKKALHDYLAFLFGAVVIVACVLIAERLPTWLPAAAEFFSS